MLPEIKAIKCQLLGPAPGSPFRCPQPPLLSPLFSRHPLWGWALRLTRLPISPPALETSGLSSGHWHVPAAPGSERLSVGSCGILYSPLLNREGGLRPFSPPSVPPTRREAPEPCPHPAPRGQRQREAWWLWGCGDRAGTAAQKQLTPRDKVNNCVCLFSFLFPLCVLIK